MPAPNVGEVIQSIVERDGLAVASGKLQASSIKVQLWAKGQGSPPPGKVVELAYQEYLAHLPGPQEQPAAPDQAEPSSVWNTLPEAAWEGKKVCLGLPWYKTTNPATALSLLALIDRSKMGVIMAFGDAFISHTRNRIAGDFLKTTAEWLFFADDDMVFPMGNPKWFNEVTGFNVPDQFAGLHTLNRLLSHNKTLVGGLYFGRSPKGKPMFMEGASSKIVASEIRAVVPRNELRPTRWVATGCMMVHRSVFEAIDEKFPAIKGAWFSPSEHNLTDSFDKFEQALKDTTLKPEDRIRVAWEHVQEAKTLTQAYSRLGTGEDVIFCNRALQAGHQPFVDLGLLCGHIGQSVYGPRNTSIE